MVRVTTAVGSAVEGRHKPANACHGSVGGCPCRQETQPGQQGALAAVAAIESAGRDEEAGEDDDGGIDRPQQVAGSGMQLVTVCRLEGGLFGPAPVRGRGRGRKGWWLGAVLGGYFRLDVLNPDFRAPRRS